MRGGISGQRGLKIGPADCLKFSRGDADHARVKSFHAPVLSLFLLIILGASVAALNSSASAVESKSFASAHGRSAGSLTSTASSAAVKRSSSATAVTSPTRALNASSAPPVLGPQLAGAYLPTWDTLSLADPPATYNLLYVAFATGDGSNGGRIVYDPSPSEAPSALARDVAAAHARGQKVLLSIGGSNDLGIHLTTATEASQMVASVTAIVTAYGFDGIDWDLESDATWSVEQALSVSLSLKSTLGPAFLVSTAPAPNDSQWKVWASKMGMNLDLYGMQFYEYPATPAERISGIVSRVNEMISSYGVPASKLMIGAKTTGGSCATCTSSPQVYVDAFNQVKTQHREIRGAYVWNSRLDQSTGWSFAKVVGAAIRG
jgi:chitinase